MSTPIRFIGNYDILSEGKYLLEIVTQLRGLGVGRMITKGEWKRKWPQENSYCIVRKVQPHMDRWLLKGTVWADWIFRGKRLGVYEFSKELDRSDWHLIHRRDEHLYEKSSQSAAKISIPSRLPLPPLQQHLIKKEMNKKGANVSLDQLMIPVVPRLDPEHEMLRPFVEETSAQDVAVDGTVYDVDPATYLNLFGKELPVKIEKWHFEDEKCD